MKKEAWTKVWMQWLYLATAILFVSLSLFGCMQEQNNAMESAQTSGAASEQAALSSTPLENTEPDTEGPGTNGSEAEEDILTLLSPGQNRLSNCTQDGCYFLSAEKHLQQAENIKYIDFASQKQMYLCADPSCLHDTDACVSYIPTLFGACEVFVAYDHLFFVNFGGEEANVIQVRDLDGANARTLVTMGDSEGLDSGFFAADKTHFYYCRNDVVEENGDLSLRKTLESVDIFTGEIRKIYAMAENEFCKGSCGRYFLLRAVDTENKRMTEYAIDLQGALTDVLHLPTPWNFDERFLYYTNEGSIYQVSFTDGCDITEWNLWTGEVRVIAEDFPAVHYWDSWFGAPVDGIMPVLDSQDTPEGFRDDHYYLLNLRTGEYTPTDLYYDDEGRTRLMSPLAETVDSILVITGYRDTGPWVEGNPYVDVRARMYALIAKENYWNGIPECTPITDLEAG